MRKEEDITASTVGAVDDAADALGHLFDRLSVRDRARPDGPAGLLLPDGCRRFPLVDPIVPFEEILCDLGPVGAAGEATCLASTTQRTRQREREAMAAQGRSESARLLLAGRRERDVRAAGMAATPTPLGFPVADQPDLIRGRCLPAGLSPARSYMPLCPVMRGISRESAPARRPIAGDDFSGHDTRRTRMAGTCDRCRCDAPALGIRAMSPRPVESSPRRPCGPARSARSGVSRFARA